MKERILSGVLALSLLLPMIFLPASADPVDFPLESSEDFELSLMLFDADAVADITIDQLASAPTGLVPDPLKLQVGQQIIVALRYSGLDAMDHGGFQCLTSSICYDARYFLPTGVDSRDLEEGTVTAIEIEGSPLDTLEKWLPQELQDGYTVSASLRATDDENVRKITIQFIAEDDRSAVTILSANQGYLAAFAFMVGGPEGKEIPEADNVKLTWPEYAFGLYDLGDFYAADIFRAQDLEDTGKFIAPAAVHVATENGSGDDPDEGYTISGVVTSYNAANPITYELYKWEGAKYESTPSITGDVELEQLAETSKQRTQSFEIKNVPDGQYRLRLRKVGHLSFIINGIEIDGAGVTLTSELLGGKTISMISGDVDGNDAINTSDPPACWAILGSKDSRGDVDGNGAVNTSDPPLVWANLGKSTANSCTINLS